MIKFHKHKLANGLKVVIHRDENTPMVVVNTLYDVGARDEDPERTGFAHLFEHLMFGGSKNIKSFDKAIEQAGGYSNAFTSSDITNYYDVITAQNLETALWLEADRMLELDFSAPNLKKEKNVVIEEFNQRYLNKPYGDIWLHMKPLVYKKHPYKWNTIGDVDHIKNATLAEVETFFYRHYRPNNAVLSIAGNIEVEETIKLVEKWYGGIPEGKQLKRNLPAEPVQNRLRSTLKEANVPLDTIVLAFKMAGFAEDDYYPQNMLTDILSGGKSSRFYQNLIKKKKLFNSIFAFTWETFDPGMFVVQGTLSKGVQMIDAEEAIWDELNSIKKAISEREYQKNRNRIISDFEFGLIDLSARAFELALWELLGDADLLNRQKDMYMQVKKREIIKQADNILNKNNCSILYYYAKS